MLFFPYTTLKAKIVLSTQRYFDQQLEHDFMIIYNLEWSRVTPIQDTLVTGPQPKPRIINIT